LFHRRGLGTFPPFPADNQKRPGILVHEFNLFHNTGSDPVFYLRGNPGDGVYRFYLFFIYGTPADPDFKLAVILGINHNVFPVPDPCAPGLDNSDFIPVICVYFNRTAYK
jgi:hypothetical protein